MKLAFLCLVAVLAVLALPIHAGAQQPSDSALEARTSAVAAQLRCPVCQGLSIQDSPSELSQQMRSLVKDQLKAGKSPDEIKAYFVSKYGEWILLEPKPRGFNLLVYALPVLLVAGGIGLIAVLVRRWTRPPESAA
jgi:cytochrome c-type biogenesis protein CcmH